MAPDQVGSVVCACTLLGALADRFSGGGLGWRSTFRGRPIYYAGVVLIALGLYFGETLGLILALAFIAWRLPGWLVTPSTPAEVEGTLVRHLLPGAILVVTSVVFHTPSLITATAFAVTFSLAATALAVLNGKAAADGKDLNAYVELIRGAIFGLLSGLVLTGLLDHVLPR